jgi:hypothetical protein
VDEDHRPNHSISKEQLKTIERVSLLRFGPRVALVKLVFSSSIKVKVGFVLTGLNCEVKFAGPEGDHQVTEGKLL